MNLNVLVSNPQYPQAAKVIRQYNPDIVALEEINQAWITGLAPVLKDYPYQKNVPLENAFGIGLYSKFPLSDVQVKAFGNPYGAQQLPSITAKVHILKTETFTIVVTHPLPPMAGFSVRNSQLADIALQRTSFGRDWILTGDLNTSPWSPYFVKLIQQTGLRDSQLGFGVQPSWPVDSLLFRIPIDHVLVSERFVVLNRELGPNTGSDHLPVIVELGLKARKP
jgi:endonuclease/exonuclease/phosphatase (EEP) superfamily protein YafD